MMERRSGAIINVVSIAGHNGGGPGAGTYATAKAGLTSFTKSLAKEMAPHGVRVNAVSPGVIDTPFHEMFSTPEMIAGFVKTIPLGRVGKSEECAKVIAFLASDAASYIVGETIEINGGQLMRLIYLAGVAASGNSLSSRIGFRRAARFRWQRPGA